ncbi:hypothetical protein C0991_007450, partial [Blastosporella zonata]
MPARNTLNFNKGLSETHDRTPTGLAKLHTKVNAALATIDTGSGSMNKTLVWGIQAAEKPDSTTSALIVELDTPESAQRLLGYTADNLVDFPEGLLGTSATVTVDNQKAKH